MASTLITTVINTNHDQALILQITSILYNQKYNTSI